MVKQRFGTADVAAEVACLRKRNIVGMRVTNIYDISPKIYVIKFARSGEDGDKVLLLIESGARFHTVDTMPDKSDIPSNFVMKLRRHIRSRRLETIAQLGVDRVVQLTFGSADNTFHLLLEFYAQGNVILTDKNYEVLTLLRSHRDDSKGHATMARHTYPIHTIRLREPIPASTLDDALDDTSLSSKNEAKDLKSILSTVLPYGSTAAEHVILHAGLDLHRCPANNQLTAEERSRLLSSTRLFEKWLDECEDKAPGGCITTAPSNQEEYIEFQPLLLDDSNTTSFEQFKNTPKIYFPSFDLAVSEFFGKIHGQRAAAQQAQREKHAVGKLESIRKDHEMRLEVLEKEIDESERKAMLIELNLELVDAAMNAVREALAGGMDWRDLGQMIKEEKKAGNPLAAQIDSLQLEKNKITLLLKDPLEEDEEEEDEEEEDEEEEDEEDEEEEDEEEEDENEEEEESMKNEKKVSKKNRNKQSPNHHSTMTKVLVDLDLTAYANARDYFDARRRHIDKARRTFEANEHALTAAEKRARAQLDKVKNAAGSILSNIPARKPYWFERFHFFISSENYLVISGRDAQQNELLVKRYMKKGDIYVHADLHGASSMIIKNADPQLPIPPMTLAEAGQACVCRSAAWDAKIVASAWWVYPEQVSKTAPTGEYLTTGSFMIRGKKNYLPPQPLVMGIAFLFKLEEGSIAAHIGERAPRLMDRGVLSNTTVHHNRSSSSSSSDNGGDGSKKEILENDTTLTAAATTTTLHGTDLMNEKDRGEEIDAPHSPITTTDDTTTATNKSPLDAFMDMSFESLQERAQQQQQQHEKVSMAFDRYNLEGSVPQQRCVGKDEDSQHGEYTVDIDGGTGNTTLTSLLMTSSSQQQKEQRRHLSTKERQLLKKGGKGASLLLKEKQEDLPHGDHNTMDVIDKSTAPNAATRSEHTRDITSHLQKQVQSSNRGAKSKKSQRKKYDDQDEEEKELAMALLKSSGQKKDRKVRKEERRARVAARKGAQSGLQSQAINADDIAKLTARLEIGIEQGTREKEEEEEDDDIQIDMHGDEEEITEDTDNEEEEEEEENEEQQRMKEHKEAALLLADEENIILLDDDDKEKLTLLDELTGCPRPEDVLLCAVPVIAPYQVVANYKYRVKVVPGGLKKGKSFRQARELLTGGGSGGKSGGGNDVNAAAIAAAKQREKDLIKAVPEMDGINAAIGGVKLQVAGMQKMQQQAKKAKKKKK